MSGFGVIAVLLLVASIILLFLIESSKNANGRNHNSNKRDHNFDIIRSIDLINESLSSFAVGDFISEPYLNGRDQFTYYQIKEICLGEYERIEKNVEITKKPLLYAEMIARKYVFWERFHSGKNCELVRFKESDNIYDSKGIPSAYNFIDFTWDGTIRKACSIKKLNNIEAIKVINKANEAERKREAERQLKENEENKAKEIPNAIIDELLAGKVIMLNDEGDIMEEPTEAAFSQDDDNDTMIEDDFDYMEGHEFEYYCATLLEKNGYSKVQVTKGSGDQGVDIIAYKDDIRFGIQCKRVSSPLGNHAIQEVFAGKSYYNCHIGIVLTNNYFTPSAIELAKHNGIILWNREKLLQLVNSAQI